MEESRDDLFQQARASALAARGLTESDLQGAVPKQSPLAVTPLKHTTGLSAHGQTIVVARSDTVEFRCIGIAYGWNEEPIYDQAGKLTNNLTPTEEALANAKLWVAAPDLLKALQAFVDTAGIMDRETGETREQEDSQLFADARAALAKAGAA